MGNTVRYFQYHTSLWEKMAMESEDRGWVCYAHRQASIWKGFRERAKDAFGDNAV